MLLPGIEGQPRRSVMRWMEERGERGERGRREGDGYKQNRKSVYDEKYANYLSRSGNVNGKPNQNANADLVIVKSQEESYRLSTTE